MKPDQFHGQGGTYELVNGVRRLVKGSTLMHHADGDAARDADGAVIGAVDLNAKPEAALPEPQPAPWDTAASAKPETTKRGSATAVDTTPGKGA